ncbi:MAG: 16S rRNA (cytidine(1402)-2'-O)-methyltransferase [Patescibacteria group bacterium]
MPAGTLFIVATPIGNLGDMTLRAIETLKEVSAVLSEDTRVTSKLLKHFEIEKSLISFHEHTDQKKAMSLVERLEKGESFALVTDAGTPGLSDPGNRLVEFALMAGIRVVPIPGASALGAMVSVAGIDMREFIFRGFPPHKKGRETFFKAVASSDIPVVYYESPHRVLKSFESLKSFSPEKKLIVGRELTKMFEEIIRGTSEEVLDYFGEHPEKVKGEFSVIAYN